MGRCSRTLMTVCQHFGSSIACSLVRLRILTGRRHQIRLHLAHIGGPVVGDAKYTALPSQLADAQWCDQHCLHRCSLTFFTASFANSDVAPGKRVAYEDLPAKLKGIIASLPVVKRFDKRMWRWKRSRFENV